MRVAWPHGLSNLTPALSTAGLSASARDYPSSFCPATNSGGSGPWVFSHSSSI